MATASGIVSSSSSSSSATMATAGNQPGIVSSSSSAAMATAGIVVEVAASANCVQLNNGHAVVREVVCEIPGVSIYADGAVDRSTHDQHFPTTPAHPDEALYGALSKDVTVHQPTGVWVRIYLPQEAAKRRRLQISTSSAETSYSYNELDQAARLPIVVYFHGGGFVMASAASSFAHHICCKVSAKLNVMVVSVNYRLAPEHRLPAAFDDGFTALKWLQLQSSETTPSSEKEAWLAAHGDYRQCFVMGQGSGATVAHQVAIRCSSSGENNMMLPDLQICGLIMDIPFFGGMERTVSEMKFGDAYVDGVPQMKLSDDFWAFSLPVGSDRSHPYCDFRSSEAPDLTKLVRYPPSIVALGGLDPFYDRQIEYVEALRRGGHEVRLLVYPEKDHAIYFPEVEGEMENAYAEFSNFLVTFSKAETQN